ncbi:hypothetical protein ACU8OQ_12270 [Rhizobium leguminosarum]
MQTTSAGLSFSAFAEFYSCFHTLKQVKLSMETRELEDQVNRVDAIQALGEKGFTVKERS